MTEYKNREIRYTDDGRLMDGDFAIMMEWEKPIMEFQGENICRNGGNILNIGFGMGYIDDAIERYKIDSHHIVEIHPVVQQEILKRGWGEKPHVKLHFGDWREFIDKLPKFDGIYIDTWDENFIDFINNVHSMLNPGGIFSWFNNPKDDLDKDGLNDQYIHILKDNFHIRYETMVIPKIDSPEKQTGRSDLSYWSPKDLTILHLFLY